MPHHAKPFFRKGRGWYVQLGKQQFKLTNGPQNSQTEATAWECYHSLMAEQGKSVEQPKVDGLVVAQVFDKYLAWCQLHREARTYEWYHDHIQDFVNRNPDLARLPALELRPFHVVEWADSHGQAWSNAYRRGGIVAIQRPFNWAAEMGYIATSPIKKVAKPQPQRREQVISPEEWAKIRDHYREGDPFRDILEFSWESGCRPQEAKRVEARHVELDQHRVVFPPAEAKGKKRWRIIYLTARAEEVIKGRLLNAGDGVLFTNEDGRPWTSRAMACRFGRLKKHLGVRFACYSIRHGFCERKLEEGIDHLTVAALMGHSSGKMVAEVYSHLNKADEHLRKALTKEESGG